MNKAIACDIMAVIGLILIEGALATVSVALAVGVLGAILLLVACWGTYRWRS
jgi:hypothetical protein